LLVAAGLLPALVACSGEGTAAQGTETDALARSDRAGPHVSLGRDVEPILMSRCSGEFCHGLSMTTASRSYAFLVNQPSLECDDMRPLVTPGNPSRSYLVDKMLDRNLCSGHPMPRGLSNRLSQGEILAVTEWIRQGARND
jgi:hypothetical protein